MRALFAVIAMAVVTACSSAEPSEQPAMVPYLRAEVVETLPHDVSAFTQGLELADGTLYEGTGRQGESSMRAVDPKTGAVLREVPLPAELFGEGITVVDDVIWQLTWQDGIALRRDRETLAERDRAEYEGEGWGLCHDGERLVMSDGSAELTFRDPGTFEETGRREVRDGDDPVTQLNELECVDGQVYANVWQTDRIVRIDPETGQLTANVDLEGLLSETESANADVLNGIAAIPGTDEFLVTGKYWPKMFRVRFVPR